MTGLIPSDEQLLQIIEDWEGLTRLTYRGDSPAKYVNAAQALRKRVEAVSDLLAFARASRESLSSRRESDLDDIEMDLLNMADAAIAKAEGKL